MNEANTTRAPAVRIHMLCVPKSFPVDLDAWSMRIGCIMYRCTIEMYLLLVGPFLPGGP